MRLDKPIGIYLLLWPTLMALWIAGSGRPNWHLVVIFTLGVVLTRSAGCVINDYADRDFDQHVARTRDRPITSGTVSPQAALILFVGLLLVAFILVLQTNTLTILLSVAAAMLMSVYPFMKRFIQAPQLILGIAFSWAVPMAFAAQTGMVPWESLWIMGYVISWAIVYDTMYAMEDMEDDLKIRLKSTAILFAPHQTIWIAVFQILMVLCLLMTGISFALTWAFYLGVLLVVFLMGFQHWKIKQGHSYFAAFLENHRFGLIMFISTIFSYISIP